MNYTQFSERAQTDLQIVLGFMDATGQTERAEALTRAIQANSTMTHAHVRFTLEKMGLDGAPAAIKQRVGMLLAYVEAAGARGGRPQPDSAEARVAEYGRDRQARLARNASTRHGRTSWRASISLRSDLVAEWEAMSPEERGDWIAARWDAE